MTDHSVTHSSDNHAEHADATYDSRIGGALRGSMSWSLASTLFSQLVTIGVFVILTYKLDPAVFGVFALASIAVDYFFMMFRWAATDATMQGNRMDQRSLDTIAWTMFGVMTLVAIAISLLGFGFAELLREPDLKYVMPALAVILLLIPHTIPCEATIMRRHDFRGLAVRSMVANAAGAVAALVVVFGPFPAWALVAQRGVMQGVSLVMLLLTSGYRPGFQFDKTYAPRVLRTSVTIFTAQAIASTPVRILDLSVGLIFGTAAVGLLRIAMRFIESIYGAVVAPVSGLWVILLSEGTHSISQRQRIYRKLTQMSAFVCVPVFAGLALIAIDLVDFALDDRYAPSGTLLTLLSAFGVLAPLAYFRNAGFIALKKYPLLVYLAIADIIILIALILLLSKLSLPWVVGSLLVLEITRSVTCTHVLLKEMQTPFSEILASVEPAFLGALWMAAAILGADLLLPPDAAALSLGVKIALGSIVYCGFIWLFHRSWAREAIDTVRKK